jgi:hypothetical protein
MKIVFEATLNNAKISYEKSSWRSTDLIASDSFACLPVACENFQTFQILFNG